MFTQLSQPFFKKSIFSKRSNKFSPKRKKEKKVEIHGYVRFEGRRGEQKK